MKTIKAKPYEKLALIYDHLMDHVNYDLWAKYIHQIGKEFVDKNANVLELAGGNGKVSSLLKKYYTSIVISDLSIEMLTSKKNSIPKVCCEMTSLPFKSKFDFIYSTFDSINYLTRKKEIIKLFNEINCILTKNGIFTFDVCLEQNSLSYSAVPLRRAKTKNIVYDHLSIYNKRTKYHSNIFEIKLNDGTTFREIHKQKIYPFELYFELLEKTDLYAMDCFEAFSFKKAKPKSKRIQFIVKKIPDAIIQ
jgi:ubiquinone/menaquinone biosynthesis C-methylase UbiE